MVFRKDSISLQSGRLLQVVIIIFLFAFFMIFAGGGLWAEFTGDDLMNLHRYMEQGFAGVVQSILFFWSTAFRPLGGLFYLTIYNIFGFDPLPFRFVCFVFLIVNQYLAYRFIVTLSRSRATGVLAALLFCYHAWFVDLYYSSGTVYDLLCFFFYFSAFIYYLRFRETGRSTFKNWAIFVALYICALDSKEMAVTLPLFIAVYEAIFHTPRCSLAGLRRWIVDNGAGFLTSGLVTIPYVLGKLLLKGSLVENPAFALNISPTVFLDRFHLYLNPLFYQDHVFRDPNTIQLLLIMLIFALWRRNRHLLFAWFYILLSGLPVFFMAHCAAFFMYIPSVGWALYIAGAIMELGRILEWFLLKVFGGKMSGKNIMNFWQVSAFLVISVFLMTVHPAESRKTFNQFRSIQQPVGKVMDDLDRLQLNLPRGSRIYFANDPFPASNGNLLFLVRLYYHDMTLEIGRGKPGAVMPAKRIRYQAALDYRNGHLVEIPLPPEGN